MLSPNKYDDLKSQSKVLGNVGSNSGSKVLRENAGTSGGICSNINSNNNYSNNYSNLGKKEFVAQNNVGNSVKYHNYSNEPENNEYDNREYESSQGTMKMNNNEKSKQFLILCEMFYI